MVDGLLPPVAAPSGRGVTVNGGLTSSRDFDRCIEQRLVEVCDEDGDLDLPVPCDRYGANGKYVGHADQVLRTRRLAADYSATKVSGGSPSK